MDSLTQIVLGASVTEACLGKKIGNKAVLWGAIAGTIPDLDVLSSHFVDNIRALEIHRGFSHSIIFSILGSIALGWGLSKLYIKQAVSLKEWIFAMFLAMFTHTLIDALTTWGTQIFWPFDTRIAIKSVFVIDPLYTLPFMIFLIISMFKRKDDDKRRKYNKLGLMISSGYLVFGLFMKTFINQQFTSSLERQGIQYEAIETRPTPLNTIMWSANIKTKNGFITGDYSIFDTQPEIEFSDELKKQDYLIESFKEENKIQILKRMTKGWYVIEQQGDKLIFNDLRFGRIGMSDKNAQFAFSYELFYDENGVFQAMERPKSMDSGKEAFKDLFDRIGGN